jgi:hypothetical protein
MIGPFLHATAFFFPFRVLHLISSEMSGRDGRTDKHNHPSVLYFILRYTKKLNKTPLQHSGGSAPGLYSGGDQFDSDRYIRYLS